MNRQEAGALTSIEKSMIREVILAALAPSACSCESPEKHRLRIARAMIKQSGSLNKFEAMFDAA